MKYQVVWRNLTIPALAPARGELHASRETAEAELAQCQKSDAAKGFTFEIVVVNEALGFGAPRLYLDCDGVLANFDRAFEERFGRPPREFEAEHGPTEFWRVISEVPEFYRRLPLLPNARRLFAALEHLRPIVLTGCPVSGNWAVVQKIEWVSTHFPGVPVITCLSREKRAYCRPGDVLIDDQLKYSHLWREAGGLFVHYKGDVDATLEEVRRIR